MFPSLLLNPGGFFLGEDLLPWCANLKNPECSENPDLVLEQQMGIVSLEKEQKYEYERRSECK